jgi:hypothetical protein
LLKAKAYWKKKRKSREVRLTGLDASDIHDMSGSNRDWIYH